MFVINSHMRHRMSMIPLSWTYRQTYIYIWCATHRTPRPNTIAWRLSATSLKRLDSPHSVDHQVTHMIRDLMECKPINSQTQACSGGIPGPHYFVVSPSIFSDVSSRRFNTTRGQYLRTTTDRITEIYNWGRVLPVIYCSSLVQALSRKVRNDDNDNTSLRVLTPKTNPSMVHSTLTLGIVLAACCGA